MKQIYIVGNWKSNKTLGEARSWLDSFKMPPGEATVIVCAPFTLLSFLHEQKPQFQLGAQDVSQFGEGAYTGEVSATQLKEFVDWVIIGHSERRNNFGETDEVLAKKVAQARSVGLGVIYCVPDENSTIPAGVDIVAYEPVWAIGTGKNDTPQNANRVIESLKSKFNQTLVIYGGSVTQDNVASFVTQPLIDGVLPGGASLDPVKFAELIQNASNA